MTSGDLAGPGWPMPIEEFLSGNYLNRSDVVLCRGRKTLFSKLIRWATRSYFSHCAIVFLVPSPAEGFAKTFLIEAVPSGVDVTDLRHYAVDHADVYDVVVKRLERPWFTEDVQKLVRGHMLDFIKADYDFRTIFQIAKSVLWRILFGLHARVAGLEQAVRAAHRQKRLAPTQFVCSGFVQYGFMSTVELLIERGSLPPDALTDVCFNARLAAGSDTSAIVATTPEDFAKSDRLVWKYVILNKMVHPVSTGQQVAALLGSPDVW